MKHIFIAASVALFLIVRHLRGRRTTLADLGAVYFAIGSIIGGIDVLIKCHRGNGGIPQLNEADLMFLGFGIFSMVWISVAEIRRHLEAPK